MADLPDAVLSTSDRLADVLDSLLPIASQLPPDARDSVLPLLDSLLERLRLLAASLDLSVVPERWSFAGVESIPDDRGLNVRHVFRRDTPAGTVTRLKCFGLVEGDAIERQGEVLISAGPPPPGLTELESLAGTAPDQAAARLKDAFASLRPAGARGDLETAVVDLYVLYWEQVRALWLEQDATATARFDTGLDALLSVTFGIEPFHPVTFREHPEGWISCPPGTRMTTGRVTRTLRPGLRTAEGHLRLPAVVEAE